MNFVVPPRLMRADKVAIVSPSSGLAAEFPWVYELGLRRLKDVFGLEPIEFPTARKDNAYLENNPEARAADINAACADPEIKAILATIGGNDQIRILPYLNSDLIKSNPKIFLGYSDCTNLHLYLWKLGIVSYYGMSVMVQLAMQGKMHQYTVDYAKKAIADESIGQIHPSAIYTDYDLDWSDPENLNKERPQEPHGSWEWHNRTNQIIKGRLWGGCLETLYVHFRWEWKHANNFLPSLDEFNDIVLYLETSEEMPSSEMVYNFMLLLCQLGILQRIRALLVARPKSQFLGMVPPEGRTAFIGNQKNGIKQALATCGSKIPVIFNLNFGHTDPQLIIPNGGSATINCAEKTISFE